MGSLLVLAYWVLYHLGIMSFSCSEESLVGTLFNESIIHGVGLRIVVINSYRGWVSLRCKKARQPTRLMLQGHSVR